MLSFLDTSSLAFLVAWCISVAVTPISIWLMWKSRVVDDPQNHKHAKVVHSYPVPRGGGVPIFVALIICTLLFLPIDGHSLSIMWASFLTLGVGLIDDKFDLSPYIRLVTNLIAALIVISQGIVVNYITNPLTGNPIEFGGIITNIGVVGWEIRLPIVSIIVTIVWIVGLMNMIGQGAGGIEGQLPGVVVIASVVIAIMSNRYSADITLWPVSVLAMIVAGTYLGFLAFNFFPQKIMPGYSGKSLAGLLLAIMAILSTSKIGLLLTVLGVPLIDTFITYMRRVWIRRSPLMGDRGHLHHRFLDSGFSKPVIVFIYWILTGILGISALLINSQQKMYALIAVGIGVSFLLLNLKKGSNSEPN